MKKTFKTALITGASSGLGYEFAKQLAAQYCNLILVARTVSKMTELANELESKHNIKCLVLEKDLTRPQAPKEIYEELMKRKMMPDLLINNAGSGLKGEFSHLDLQRQLEMIQLNVSALVSLTHLLLPSMMAQKNGGVLNVASTAGFQPGPLMAIYYASKAFVLSFSEALHEEVKDKGIAVSALCPGPVATGFQAAAQMNQTRLFKSGLVMTSEKVVKSALRGLQCNCAVIVPGFSNKFGTWGVRLSPRSAARQIAGYLNSTV